MVTSKGTGKENHSFVPNVSNGMRLMESRKMKLSESQAWMKGSSMSVVGATSECNNQSRDGTRYGI